jgi:hypothetical protein
MKLIVLIGKKRSGKDTTAEYIMENYNSVKFQLAGPIKQYLAEAYAYEADNPVFDMSHLPKLDFNCFEGIGYDREEILPLKPYDVLDIFEHAIINLNKILPIQGIKIKTVDMYPRPVEYLTTETKDQLFEVINNINNWSVRHLMQTLGTDVIVNQFDKMYWVKLFALDYFDKIYTDANYYVVPDVRQQHEIDSLRAMGATVIHVVRSESDQVQDSHITEAGLPILPGDVVIKNDGTLSELYNTIDKLLGNKNV